MTKVLTLSRISDPHKGFAQVGKTGEGTYLGVLAGPLLNVQGSGDPFNCGLQLAEGDCYRV